MKKSIIGYILIIAVVTFVFLTIFASAQFVLRSTANDPQIQIAQDLASKLLNGASPDSLIGQKVNLYSSQAPFVIVYNSQNQVIASSGEPNSKTPSLPNGVLDAAKSNTNKITWQPQKDTRYAAVITPAGDKGFVLSGRSLKETELRIERLMQLVGFAWVLSILLVVASFFCFNRQKK